MRKFFLTTSIALTSFMAAQAQDAADKSDKAASSHPEEISAIARIGESILVPTKLMEEKPNKVP